MTFRCSEFIGTVLKQELRLHWSHRDSVAGLTPRTTDISRWPSNRSVPSGERRISCMSPLASVGLPRLYCACHAAAPEELPLQKSRPAECAVPTAAPSRHGQSLVRPRTQVDIGQLATIPFWLTHVL